MAELCCIHKKIDSKIYILICYISTLFKRQCYIDENHPNLSGIADFVFLHISGSLNFIKKIFSGFFCPAILIYGVITYSDKFFLYPVVT